MKKLLSLLLALALVFSLAACSSKTDDTTTDDTQGDANAESVDLVVFAAASMTETLTQIAEMYKEVAPNVMNVLQAKLWTLSTARAALSRRKKKQIGRASCRERV